MSVTYIPEKIKIRLWGKAAGRCQYEGCNTPLWLDTVTQVQFNVAYIAHIVADSPDGPRGDKVLSELLAADITNLMLLCDAHHRLVDKEDVEGHPVRRLQEMKQRHEERIELVTGITEDKKSHILLYGANIGEHGSPLTYRAAAAALPPHRYPASGKAIEIGTVNSAVRDDDPDYWRSEEVQVRKMVERVVRPSLADREITHLSIFGLAPQPLLILLGSLLSDIPAAEAYQLRREPVTWRWDDEPLEWKYVVSEPSVGTAGNPALVFSLSATVDESRVTEILGADVPVWHVSVERPHNDFVRSRIQVERFRQTMRQLMDRIKARHGEAATIHVFPSMPVSLAVDFGRILMPKADLPLVVYDQQRKSDAFVRALEVNARG